METSRGELIQAREFVLEAWVEMQEDYDLHTCWKDDTPHIYDKVYNMCRPFPEISRAMIKELIEEVDKDGKWTRDRKKFADSLIEIIGEGRYTNLSSPEILLLFIFATLEDLIMAFALAHREVG